MKKLVECVPNFSEGRRPEILEAIVNEIQEISGVFLLDKELDADHNRAVVTIVGEPEPTQEAAFRMIKKAADLIDLTVHNGEHPRMGATDVVPFIPIQNMTTDECVQLAKGLGQRVGEELQIPVYLYEDAASRPERKNLAKIRKGQFEGLREEIGTNPERVPDYGPNRIHPTAGATAIGARFFLVAYNVNLDTQDIALAKEIAKKIRESSGGFRCVKAMGFELADRNLVQVSMNMINYTVTSLATVFLTIQEYARQAGVDIVESEIVGLVPKQALVGSVVELLKVKDFNPAQILENRMTDVIEPATEPQRATLLASTDAEFLTSLASGSATPGGGSASALAGALAGALATMVCNLTLGKKKYQEVCGEITQVREQAQQLQAQLQNLVAEDSKAFTQVMDAYALPKSTDDEKTSRKEAIQTALKAAVAAPLQVMRHALDVIKLTKPLAERGNLNAITDVGCAVHLASAALAGAALNVRINLSSIKDQTFTDRIDAETRQIQRTADEYTTMILNTVEAAM